ncbi:MAG: 6-bladed beta-propeller [Roseivirga sp.]|jgi:hypothetical protein|uniref:6-bladed beta-propeller n=1 Tax=Roseivirga sp. TaxID=1964215 RepID=UPI001B05F534|nr:6-bladed beta-propeller [Roseivirga sp.]MBO6495123.1 6-bladed beta-propeller [Roseivirga sp.]
MCKALITGGIALFFLSACNSGSNKSFELDKDKSFASIKLSTDLETKHLSELVETVEVIRLEETSQSLVSSVRDLELSEEYLVFPDSRYNDVFVFDHLGNFVTKWNHQGQGPREYHNIQDIWLEGDTVAVYARGKAVLRYTIDGKFLNSEAIEYQADHIRPYDGGYFLDMNFNAIDDTLTFKAVVLDSNLSRVDELLAVKSFSKVAFYSDISAVMTSGNTILYMAMLTDTVYQYHKGELSPRFHFDFGEEWFWEDESRNTENYYERIMNETQPKVHSLSAKIGKQYLYLFANQAMAGFQKYLIDHRNNRAVMLKKYTLKSMKYGVSILNWSEGLLIGAISSYELEEWLSSIDKSQIAFSGTATLEEIESSENPVLLKIRLKESSEW